MKPRELNEAPGTFNEAPESSNLIVVYISTILAMLSQQKHSKFKGDNRFLLIFVLCCLEGFEKRRVNGGGGGNPIQVKGVGIK